MQKAQDREWNNIAVCESSYLQFPEDCLFPTRSLEEKIPVYALIRRLTTLPAFRHQYLKCLTLAEKHSLEY